MTQLSIQQIQELMDNSSINLIGKAIDGLESNLAKVRTLYRSQLLQESEELRDIEDLGIADGSDSELVRAIGEELKQIRLNLKQALEKVRNKEFVEIEVLRENNLN